MAKHADLHLPSLSHHAYYLTGDASMRKALLKTLEKDHSIDLVGNPDFFDRTYAVFSIDDARSVKAQADTRPTDSSGKKIFVLTMDGITTEAQNALLKLLEEPSDYVHFFIIIPSAHLLLPTVKSRMTGFLGGIAEHDMAAAEEFLKSAPAKRLEIIKDLMDEISKEKKTKQDAIGLLGDLEQALYKAGVRQHASALDAILTAKKYATDRAPSMKMLLEYVALNV